MKVIKLVAENVKGLKAVEIVPDETLQVISGKNGQGKSSVMDSIWLALGGSEATKGSNTSRAIRDGEESAAITLDLGDIIVTRKWTSNDKSSLKVESKDGSKFSSPQTMLNELIGKLSFDPLSFSNLDNKKQIETLMNMVDLPKSPKEIESQKKELFSERTIINREVKSLKLQLDSMILDDQDIPNEEIHSSDILKEMQEAQQTISENANKRSYLQKYKQEFESESNYIKQEEEKIVDLQKKIEELQESVTKRKEYLKSIESKAEEFEKEVKDLVDPDLSVFNKKLSEVEETNKKVREKKQAKSLEEQLRSKSKASEDLTEKINKLEEEKQDMIRNANFPIDGLTFDESEVLYNGVPLKQCSSAERLKVSMAIAMSLNPKLKVIRIMDGSLLDSTNLELIKEMAGEKDYQIWVEQVDESGTVGIVIENGEVKSFNKEEKLKQEEIPESTKREEPKQEDKEEDPEIYNLSF